jgi:hypothetical protein
MADIHDVTSVQSKVRIQGPAAIDSRLPAVCARKWRRERSFD